MMGNWPKAARTQKNDTSIPGAKLSTRSSIRQLNRQNNEKRQQILPLRKADLTSRKQKTRKQNKVSQHNSSNLPKIGAKIPLDFERTVLTILDQDAFLQQACVGFRFFVRNFSDKLLDNCLKNPHLNTIKRAVPPNLRYIHTLRNAWKSLTEFERIDWEHNAKFSTDFTNFCKLLGTRSQMQRCLEKVDSKLSNEKKYEQRNWLSTLSVEHLPCPLCSMQTKKRFRLNQLMAHLTLSHSSFHIYACHFCNSAFTSISLLREHGISECKKFGEFMVEIEHRTEKKMIFDFAYVSLFCAECGLQLILSTACPPEVLAETLLHIMLTHSNQSLLVCIAFSSMELQSSNIKIKFINPILSEISTSLICEECDIDEAQKIEFWTNAFELEDHCASKHHHDHDEIHARHKCALCVASFHTTELLRDHQLMEHLMIQEEDKQNFLTSLFLKNAVLIPAAKDKSETVLIGQPNCRRVCSNPHKKQNSSERGNDDEDMLMLQQDNNSTLTFANWKSQMRKHMQKISSSADARISQKLLPELNLVVSFTGTTIVQNPLDGALLNDNIFLCTNCWTLLIGYKQRQIHAGHCGANSMMANACNIHTLKLLFDTKQSFPFARITCPLCTIGDDYDESFSHCSIYALRIHFAQKHGIICNVVSNKDVSIRKCAEELLTRNWLNTEFDHELIRRINSTQLPKCTSELDAAIMAEEYSQTNLDRLSLLSQNNNMSIDRQQQQSASTTNCSLTSLLDCKNEPMDESYQDSFSAAVIDNSFPTNFIVVKREFTDEDNEHMAFTGSGISTPFNTQTFIVQDRSGTITEKQSEINTTTTNSSNNSFAEEKKTQSDGVNDSPKIIHNGEHRQQLISLSSAHLKNVSSSSSSAASKSHFVCFMCTFPKSSREAFGIHLLSHPECEYWNSCCICSFNNTIASKNDKSNKGAVSNEHFEHPIQFFKHVVEKHMNIEDAHIKCEYCGFTVLKNLPDNKAVDSMFRHMVYECVKTDFCMLCGKLFKQHKAQLHALQLRTHRLLEHRLIFDRFICLSCNCGFYSREKFIKHSCQLAYRCVCNRSYRFNTWSDFSIHMKKHMDDPIPTGINNLDTGSALKHGFMESKLEDNEQKRRYWLNNEYQREMMERIKQCQKTATKTTNGNHSISLDGSAAINVMKSQAIHKPKKMEQLEIDDVNDSTRIENDNHCNTEQDLRYKKQNLSSTATNNTRKNNCNKRPLQWTPLNDVDHLPSKHSRKETDTSIPAITKTTVNHLTSDAINANSNSMPIRVEVRTPLWRRDGSTRIIFDHKQQKIYRVFNGIEEKQHSTKQSMQNNDELQIAKQREQIELAKWKEESGKDEKEESDRVKNVITPPPALLPEERDIIMNMDRGIKIRVPLVILEDDIDKEVKNLVDAMCASVSEEIDIATSIENVIKKGMDENCANHFDLGYSILPVNSNINNNSENDSLFEKQQLKRHEKGEFRCDVCSSIFHNHVTFEQHRMAHTSSLPLNVNTWLCRQCCVAFPYYMHKNNPFYMHMKEHSNNLTACQYCSGVMPASKYDWHKSKHPSDFICSLCLLRFRNEMKLAQHLSTVHEKKLAFFCKICGFCNTNIYTVLQHMFIFDNKLCFKDFSSNQLIIDHLGVTLAAQLRFLPNKEWLNKNKDVESVETAECRHHCLEAFNGSALITCNDCCCPISLNIWKDTCYPKDAPEFNYIDHCRLVDQIENDSEYVADTVYQIFLMEVSQNKKDKKLNYIDARLQHEIIVARKKSTSNIGIINSRLHLRKNWPGILVMRKRPTQPNLISPPVLVPRPNIIQDPIDLPQQYSPPPKLTAAVPSKTLVPSLTTSLNKTSPPPSPLTPQISSTRLQQQHFYHYASSSATHTSTMRINQTSSQGYCQRVGEMPRTMTAPSPSILQHQQHRITAVSPSILQQQRQFPIPNPRIIPAYRSNFRQFPHANAINTPYRPHQQIQLTTKIFPGSRTQASPFIRYSGFSNSIDPAKANQRGISTPHTFTRI